MKKSSYVFVMLRQLDTFSQSYDRLHSEISKTYFPSLHSNDFPKTRLPYLAVSSTLFEICSHLITLIQFLHQGCLVHLRWQSVDWHLHPLNNVTAGQWRPGYQVQAKNEQLIQADNWCKGHHVTKMSKYGCCYHRIGLKRNRDHTSPYFAISV